MTEITLKGTPVHTSGKLPGIGNQAPSFELVNADLANIKLDDFTGKNIVLNIFPSIDTTVCASSATEFNQRATKLPNTVVLCISMDLPFAHKRTCEAMSLKNIIALSDFRNRAFGRDYGVTIIDSPLGGLLARAVIVLNAKHEIIYEQLVPELGDEPNYDAAMQALLASS